MSVTTKSRRMGCNMEYTNYNLLFDCRTCRVLVTRRDMISRHSKHICRPNPASLRGLALKVETYYREKLSQVIREIQQARDNFLRQEEAVKEKIEERSKLLLFGEIWKAELLRNLTDAENTLIQSWNNQEEDCRSYLKQLKNEDFTLKSMGEVANAVILAHRNYERVKYVESCDVRITAGGKSLGDIVLSPSAEKTTVRVDGKSVANELNTCVVTVRDAMGFVVKDVVDYNISAILVDPNDNPVDITIENNKNGLYSIKYFPTVTGQHSLHVTLNSIPISNDTLVIDVKDSSSVNAIVIGELGTQDSQFARPWGVCTDGYGRIYVSDRSNNRIQVFDEKGKFLYKFGREGSGPGEFKLPAGVAVDMYQRLIVADKDNHRIQILLPNGAYVSEFGQFESDEESLHYPWDVTVDRNGHIAVTEGLKHRVTLFTGEGVKLAVCNFTREMKLDFPRGIAATPDGSFLVTDFNKHKIVLLDSRLNAVASLGSDEKKAECFNRPQGIAVRDDGLFAVADCKNKCIKIFRDNRLYRIIKGEFECIQGVAFHPNGCLIVAEKEGSHVKIVRFENTTIYPSDEYFADSTNF